MDNIHSSTFVWEYPSLFFVAPFQVWLQYQCLWDMQAENIYNRLGEDLTKWQALLVQIRKARGTFDNAETRKEFGPVVIDYGKVMMTDSCRCCIWKIFLKRQSRKKNMCITWKGLQKKTKF